jgi:hypothetical protein
MSVLSTRLVLGTPPAPTRFPPLPGPGKLEAALHIAEHLATTSTDAGARAFERREP